MTIRRCTVSAASPLATTMLRTCGKDLLAALAQDRRRQYREDQELGQLLELLEVSRSRRVDDDDAGEDGGADRPQHPRIAQRNREGEHAHGGRTHDERACEGRDERVEDEQPRHQRQEDLDQAEQGDAGADRNDGESRRQRQPDHGPARAHSADGERRSGRGGQRERPAARRGPGRAGRAEEPVLHSASLKADPPHRKGTDPRGTNSRTRADRVQYERIGQPSSAPTSPLSGGIPTGISPHCLPHSLDTERDQGRQDRPRRT